MSGVNYPSTGWTNDLARLPRLLNSELNRLASSSGSKNKARRSYKLLTESYVVASTISACYDQEMQSMFFIRARCFRSQKKTQAPYLVHVTMSRDGRVLGGHCECPAGRKACSHLQAVLQVILLLQEKGFQEAPAHLSCTDLPQVWRRPRTQHVKASSLQSVDWRRVDEGGRDMPLPCRLYIEKFKQRSADEKRSDALLFACGLAKKIVLTSVEAQLLERNSRRQRKSLTWCQERKYRLTASNFGTVLLRRQWTDKGLGHLTSSKDLSRVPAVRYGIANEAKALQRYEEALRNTGRDVQLQCTGLFVNPEYPWLGASPDAIVYDPSEDPPWGCVEVKCPYSLKDADSEKLLTARDTCVDFDNLQHPSLKIEHPYFAQVIGSECLLQHIGTPQAIRNITIVWDINLIKLFKRRQQMSLVQWAWRQYNCGNGLRAPLSCYRGNVRPCLGAIEDRVAVDGKGPHVLCSPARARYWKLPRSSRKIAPRAQP
ncbi:hypothetical protein HPB49_016325 [Dermacentor silvarum]|uniref:Uncharacterized protein n=1 Tax=Dermacentor silvarum TaxID=543639 RepID=A0ACB8E1R9_DERSI|nr:hypothetical protein HPB49_016325 [Dermacentor silvarum]